MTDEELKAAERWSTTSDGANPCDDVEAGTRHVVALVAEVRRLRGLVKAAEHDGRHSHCDSGCNNCPWCHWDASLDVKRRHAPECPAFTEDGRVR